MRIGLFFKIGVDNILNVSTKKFLFTGLAEHLACRLSRGRRLIEKSINVGNLIMNYQWEDL